MLTQTRIERRRTARSLIAHRILTSATERAFDDVIAGYEFLNPGAYRARQHLEADNDNEDFSLDVSGAEPTELLFD